MKILKTLLVTVLICVLLFGALGCSSSTVATVNGKNITSDEYITKINQMLSSYGITFDEVEDYYVDYYQDIETGVQAANAFKDSYLDEMITQELMLQKAAELGLDQLSEEEIQAADEEAAEMLKSYRDYCTSMAESAAESDSTINVEEYAEQLYQDFLKDVAMTEEDLVEMYRQDAILQKVYDYYIEQCPVSEEDCVEYYNELVEEQKEADEEDPETAYDNYINSVYDVNVYVPSLAPERIHRVKHILTKIDEESSKQISELYYNSELDDEARAEKIEEIRKPALAKIKPQAEEILEKAKSGEDFDDLMKEYSADYHEESDNIYEAYEGAGLVPEFIEGAMKLKNTGDISDLVASDYGYHILKSVGTPKAGPVSYEEVKEQIRSLATEKIQGEFWQNTLEQWLDEANVTRISFINGEGDNISGEGSPDYTVIIVSGIVAAAAIVAVIIFAVKYRKKHKIQEEPQDSVITETDSEKTEDEDSETQPEIAVTDNIQQTEANQPDIGQDSSQDTENQK